MKPGEISRLASELFEMSKQYLAQETVDPMRRVAAFAGYSLLAGVLFTLGWLLLTIAGLRLVLDLLPDHALWSGLGYLAAALVAVLISFAAIGFANRSNRSDQDESA
ncbi:MAG: hypothetical protein F4Y75_01890 [Acidimicrobiia bacterium]|nr:hypothetical protein [bacterium]MXX64750.1 hypothetical protein [Acidimicrobiia bacterium]MCY3579712.1 hypothetical protein [bacterium]MCY3652536.1 hypothetical protein [bacterium]MDE0643893.1 hypothetical protein [bacterium]